MLRLLALVIDRSRATLLLRRKRAGAGRVYLCSLPASRVPAGGAWIRRLVPGAGSSSLGPGCAWRDTPPAPERDTQLELGASLHSEGPFWCTPTAHPDLAHGLHPDTTETPSVKAASQRQPWVVSFWGCCKALSSREQKCLQGNVTQFIPFRLKC